MLNFTAIDFETANIQRSSVFCWLGDCTWWRDSGQVLLAHQTRARILQLLV